MFYLIYSVFNCSLNIDTVESVDGIESVLSVRDRSCFTKHCAQMNLSIILDTIVGSVILIGDLSMFMNKILYPLAIFLNFEI